MFSRFNWPVGGFFLLGVAMIIGGIYSQQQIPARVPLAQQLKERQLVNTCNTQCKAQQVSCKGGSMAACYRAAACKCECYLQQEPDNISGVQWRQCVQQNSAKAESLAAHETLSASSKAAQ